MPTTLERGGDFSQTLDVGGRQVPILDPTTLKQYPGNVIPKSVLNAYGQALLNLFPQPFLFNRSITGGSYNYQFQDIQRRPKHLDTIKEDYIVSKADHLTIRYRHWKQATGDPHEVGLSRHREVGPGAQHARVPGRIAGVETARPPGLHGKPAGW
jgi:hypothetical protein